MLSFRNIALFVVVSSLSDQNNRWIASAAGSLRGDNKNDNTDVDVDVDADIDVDEELSSSSSSRQLASPFDLYQPNPLHSAFDMNRNHNGYGGSYGNAINGGFTGSYDNIGYGGNYGGGEGYDWNYGNPLPPGPYEMNNNNGGYGGGYGNLMHQAFDMNYGINNNGGYGGVYGGAYINGGYGGNYGNPMPGPYGMNNNNGYGGNYGYGGLMNSNGNGGGALQLRDDARAMYDLMMQYRNQMGKPTVPVSSGLTTVAEAHCEDLFASHYPVSGRNTTPNGCNTHSWYNPPRGATPCCYTEDHQQATCMWDKPKQLSNYKGNGYEIAHGPLSSANPNIWMEDWKRSQGHNDVIIENPPFQQFHAVGVACCGTPNRQFAVTWFGTEYDPQSNGY